MSTQAYARATAIQTRADIFTARPLFRAGLVLLALFFAALTVLPLLVLLKVSISAPQDIMTARPPFLIYNPTLDHWRDILRPETLFNPARHSLTVATGTAVLAVLIAAPAAYVISRLPRGWRYGTILGLLFTRMFPDVAIAMPISIQFLRLGLNDTDLGLILAHLVPNLPFVAWILVGTFETIPRELEEASAVDGNGRLGTLARVVMPLAAPGIAVAALFAWLASWNDLVYAIYLFLAERTLPLMTYYYSNRGSVFDTATFAVLLTIPVMIVTLFLQRYVEAGTLSGAVKG
ncbi:MAG: carbohydrate ABC transporter permease [Chloroflexota bacterium]|nr:carbohydrate ABC transporter permease [Chloroflexota bacterium]